MSGHPQRMLTDRELSNFGSFLAKTGFNRPQGAFDSLPPELRRMPRRGIPTGAFAKGGAFDEGEPEATKLDPMGMLTLLAGKLSSEDWSKLQAVFCGEDPRTLAEQLDDGAADNDINDLPQNGTEALGGRVDSRPAMDSAALQSFRESFPDLARVGADPYPRDNRASTPPAREAVSSFNAMFPGAVRHV